MMDIYVRAGQHDQVETIFSRGQLNIISCSVLIKSLGKADKADKADKATALLKSMLGESGVKPNVQTFNALMNAWAECSRPDA